MEAAATLTEKARTAQRERRWAEAEALWRAVLRAKPGDRAAKAGLGTLLIARGRVEEARALVDALLAADARDAAGLTLAARVAAGEGDWRGAVNVWRALLAVKGDAPAALAGLGTALLAIPDLEGAAQWAGELTRRFPDQPLGAMFAARVAAARGDGAESLRLWQAAAKQFPGDRMVLRELCRALMEAGRLDDAETEAHALLAIDREEGLTQLGNVMARRRPDDDLTDLWKSARGEFPANTTFLRRQALNALKYGRADDAIAAMDALLAGNDVSLNDVGLVVGVANVFVARNDTPALRRAVHAFLMALRSSAEYRLGALRLCRTIFAHFTGHRARARSWRERSLRMVQHSPLKPKARAVLTRSLSLEAKLVDEAPALLDTDVSRDECRAFVARVRERMARREPFSFVRMNDAESSAFPYEPHLAPHCDSDAAEREIVWWGRAVAPAERAVMATRVAEAAWSADAIGIVTFARILRDVRLDENDDLNRGRTGRGLLTGLAAFERWHEFRPAGLAPPLFASANLHQDLQRWDVYGELFDGTGDIVLVTCHPDLADVMKAEFGVGIAANIVVPPRHASIPLMKKRADTPYILPEVIDDVVADVRAQAKDRMVVVGAGYLGKWIVHQARDAGGVALDLGSALDYWMGLKTRSYQDLA